jgi:hypothetical protein
MHLWGCMAMPENEVRPPREDSSHPTAMAMHLTKKKAFLLAATACLALPIIVFAATTTYDAANTGLAATADAAQLNTSQTLPVLIGTVIKIALGLVGVIFLTLMVYAGATWMIARGDESRAEKARDTIVASVIGLVIVVGAYAITNFVISAFSQPSSGQPAAKTDSVTSCPSGTSAECAGNATRTQCVMGVCSEPPQ